MTTIKSGDTVTLLFPYNDDVFTVTAKYTGLSMTSGDTDYYQFKKDSVEYPKNYLLSKVQLKQFMGGDLVECLEFEVDLG